MLEAIFGIVLHALELHLKLLIAILELLERSGHLAEGALHPVEPDGNVAGIGLCDPARRLRLLPLRCLPRLPGRFATVEKIVEEITGRTLLLRQRGAGQKQR